MLGFKTGTQKVAGGRIPARRTKAPIPDCIDCGEAPCRCVEDTPSDVVAQMSVPSMLEQLRGGR